MTNNYKIGDRIRIVQMGNPDEQRLNGCEGMIIGMFGPFIDVTLDNDEYNLFEDIDYENTKYVILIESEIEKI